MVPLPKIQASNARAANSLPAGLVAVFAGATSGIGEHALKGFVKHVRQPKVYFIGRSEEAGTRLKRELKELNGGGEYIFLKGEFSLMKSVDEVCAEIKRREKVLNVLCMTQGTFSMRGDTEEGLPYITAVSYYSRMRLAMNLLPLISAAPHLRRVVTVFAGGFEGKMYEDDLPGRKVPFREGRAHMCSVATLTLEWLAKQYPNVSFLHGYPGAVKSNLIRKEDGFVLQLVKYFFLFTMRNKWLDPEEVREEHAFLTLAGIYPPREAGDKSSSGAGVPLQDGLTVIKGVDGVKGSGVYSVDEKGEAGEKVFAVLEPYRKRGLDDMVGKHLETEFKRITGSVSV